MRGAKALVRGRPTSGLTKKPDGGKGKRARPKGDVNMHSEGRPKQMDAVQAHPLAELLECPPETGLLLNNSSRYLEFQAGAVVFRQSEFSKGLYLVITGQFLRRTERLQARLLLGTARAGDLVELAAALGASHHTYTLSAQTDGSLLLLPLEALKQAFESYPPMRMHLLEELAREVSRAYISCSEDRSVRIRPRGSGLSPA
jgi:CRP-like cAMP-binding protein